MNQETEEIEIDLVDLFWVLWSKAWLIVLAAVASGLLFAGYTKLFIQPLYSSTSELYILSKTTSITSLADIQLGTQLTQDYQELLLARPILQQVIDNLNLPYTYEELVQRLKITNPSNTRVIKITIEEPEAAMAKAIVDEMADVGRAAICEIMSTTAPNVVYYGYASDEPVSPSLLKNTLIGVLLGGVLSAGIVVLIYLLDDTVKTTDDVEKFLKLNTLAVIPVFADEEDEQKTKHARKGKKDA